MKLILFVVFLLSIGFANSQSIPRDHTIDTANSLFRDSAHATNAIIKTGHVNRQESPLLKPVANRLQLKPLAIPAALITYGVVALNNKAVRNLDITTSRKISDGNKDFKSSVDNYLQYSPAMAVYGLNALGIKGKSNFTDRSIMFGLSTIVTAGIVCTIKPLSNVSRPDGSAANSFPSGHTTTAFAAAEFLHQEYKHKSPLYSVLGYAAATTTGILRMYNNRHYLSDVVAGAGFGMLSTKLVYWAYPIIKRKVGGRKGLAVKHSAVLP